MPLHRFPILHALHIRHRILSETGHQVAAGILHYIFVLRGGVHRAFEMLGGSLNHLRMIIVRVRQENAINLLYHTAPHQILGCLKLIFPAAIQQKPMSIIRHNNAAGGKLNDPFRRIEV